MKTQKKDLTTVAYEQGVQYHLKKVAESGSDVHENYTPAEICDMMLDKVDLTKAETVLVLYNIELLFALKKRKFSGHVTFFTQSEEKATLAPKIFSNLTVEYIDKEENPLYHMENKWPDKFDIVIANPPYGTRTSSLHLKFLEKSLKIYKEKIVFVHPSTSFIDKKGNNKNYNEINKSIQNRLESLTFFNGNGVFGITLKVPCSVTVIGPHKPNSIFTVDYLYYSNRKETLSEIEDVSLFGRSDILKSLSSKIKSHSLRNLHTEGNVLGTRDIGNRVLKNQNSFIVQFSHIQGNTETENPNLNSGLFKKNFFILANIKEYKVEHSVIPKYNIWFEFETKREAENFLSFCKTDFARFCLSMSKRNQHLSNGELKTIPWMDFTQEWTDEKLYAYFNITKEEQSFIKEIIPPYYD